LLHEYLDDALSFRLRASVEEHLRICDECGEALAQERDFSRAVSGLLRRKAESLRLSRDVRRRVMEALESGAPSPKIRRRYKRVLVRPVLAVAAAACLLVAAVALFRQHEPPPVRAAKPIADHPKSYIMCMATRYAEGSETDWIERRMIVRIRNGREGYLEITARKAPKEKQANEEKEERP
jgi:hypothetical protein